MALALCPAIGSTAIRRNTQQAQQRATPFTKAFGQWRPPSRSTICFAGRLFFFWKENGKQGNPNRSLQPAHAADARLPPHMDGVLRLLLRVVRLRAADAAHQEGVRPLRRPGREHQHRRRRGDDPRATRGRPDVRPLRSAQGLLRPVAGRRDSGARRRALDRLRELPLVPSRDRRDRRELRHHAVPHLGDVRAERRRHGERDDRRLGQRGRGRVAGAGAAPGGGCDRDRRGRASRRGASRSSCRASRCR